MLFLACVPAADSCLRSDVLPIHFQVISGEVEALYSWVAVNFLRGLSHGKGLGVGALDLGGASTQVAFAVTACDPAHFADGAGCPAPQTGLLGLELGGIYYHLFLESYLHFGSESFEAMAVNELVRTQLPVVAAAAGSEDGGAFVLLPTPPPGRASSTVRRFAQYSGHFTLSL